MSLENFPLRPKYTGGDEVYIFKDRRLQQVIVDRWRAKVTANGDFTEGTQINLYKFRGMSIELPENRVFSSPCHFLGYARNDYLNRAIASGSGGNFPFSQTGAADGVTPDFGTWTDFARMNMQETNFTNQDDDPEAPLNWIVDWANSVWDGADVAQARFPTIADTKAEFRALVKSYDAASTRWGVIFPGSVHSPIGRAISGTVAGTGGASTLTGISTAFETELRVGDVIIISTGMTIKGHHEILSIGSDTSLTIVGTFSAGNFTGYEIALLPSDLTGLLAP